VYYWRRRPPRSLAKLLPGPHLFLSLKTTSRVKARRLAVQLDLILEDAAMLADSNSLDLSASQIETMLRAVVDKQLAKLERVALAAKSAPGFTVDQARADDLLALWTYTLLDAQGYSAVVRPGDRDRMIADGLSEADIEAVKRHLLLLQYNFMVPTKYHVLRQMIEGVQAVPTAMNMEVARGIYFRGMKLALASIDRRYGASRAEDTSFVDRLVVARNDPPAPTSAVGVGDHRDPQSDPPTKVSSPASAGLAMTKFLTFANNVVAENAKGGHWDGKTQRQVTSICKLFVKFMLQDRHVQDLDFVDATHIGAFVDFLRFEIYRNYGKSSKDKGRTIAELRAVALEHDESKRGIEEDTLNRHLINLGQVFRHAAARGAKSLAEIELTKFHAKGKKGRARDERPKLGVEQVRDIFQAPPFNNCAAWNALGASGPEGAQQIFHCALYFVPMLIFYTGCRREELCGAMVNHVILDNGDLPYIHIAPNAQRRIKNIQSRRNVALHPEVLRLNFVEYVKAIKALGYDLLSRSLLALN